MIFQSFSHLYFQIKKKQHVFNTLSSHYFASGSNAGILSVGEGVPNLYLLVQRQQ